MTERAHSLRRGLLIWLIVATVLIGVLALIDTRVEADRTSEQVSDRILAGSAMAIAEGVTVDAMGGLSVMIRFSALDMLSSTAQDQVFYRVDGPDGFLTGYDDLPPAPIAAGSGQGFGDDIYHRTPIRKATIQREVTTGAGSLPVTVTVAESTRAREQLSAAILSRSALRIAGLILVAALAAWAAITVALRPLDQISQRIAARAPQDLSPIEGPAPAEILPVLAALNGFLARLQQAMSALANFSGNANHQIRTPLAVARTQIGLARKAPLSPQVADALSKADGALVQTERVLEQLLLLAQIEASRSGPSLALCDVAAIAKSAVEDQLLHAMQLGQDLGYDGPDCLITTSAEILLGELLRNLIENALLHCPKGSVVTLELRKLGDGVRIAVIDDGPPLSEAQFAQLVAALKPHAPQDRRQSGRHGLGLQIVRDIATAIGADLTVIRAESGPGLRVMVSLPYGPST